MKKTLIKQIFIVMTLFVASPCYAGNDFDGDYRGPVTLLLNNNGGNCAKGAGPDHRVTVVENKFNLYWNGQRITTTIADDGTIRGGANLSLGGSYISNIQINGTATRTTFEIDFGNNTCQYHYSMKKS